MLGLNMLIRIFRFINDKHALIRHTLVQYMACFECQFYNNNINYACKV